MEKRIIGIMGGMHEEVAGLVELLEDATTTTRGRRTYYRGRLLGQEAVVVFSRWGKVAGATTALHLILEFGITELLFTGMSGAISGQVRIGDIVIGDAFIQHDMDATPIVQRFEIPLLNLSVLPATPERVGHAKTALQAFVAHHTAMPGIPVELRAAFGIEAPRVHVGTIASGDKFFADEHEKQAMQSVLPDVLCVEMEGAAVAQVCYEYDLPFTIVRVVSDASDEKSEGSFLSFASTVAGPYSVGVVRALLGGG